MRKRTLISSLFVLAITLPPLALAGSCNRTVQAGPCVDPAGNPAVCVKVTVSFAHSGSTISEGSLFQTREVDPTVYDNATGANHVGTIKLTLNSGATVSHSQNLVLDSGTSVAPITSGYDVLVYRPGNLSALSDFIDTYESQTSSVEIVSTIVLSDVSNGTVEDSVVDAQGHHSSNYDYHGSVTTSVPSFEGPGGGGPWEK